MMVGVDDLGAVLGVWAHPDDEAYLSAGLMAAARDAGQRVIVATATYGERGTGDPDRWSPARLAALRRHELAASLAVADIHSHHWLGFLDGECDAIAPSAGQAAVGRLIDEVDPDTIITFGPEGMTGHPDHRGGLGLDHSGVAGSRWDIETALRHAHPRFSRDLGRGQRSVRHLGVRSRAIDSRARTGDGVRVHWNGTRPQAGRVAGACLTNRAVGRGARRGAVRPVVGNGGVCGRGPRRDSKLFDRVGGRGGYAMMPPKGSTARRSKTVSRRDIELFTELSGDRNPLHYDEEFAAGTRFGGLIMPGGVTSGLLNAVVAEDLPGPGSVFLRVAWNFLAPVRLGDEITAEGEVLEVHASKPVAHLASGWRLVTVR